MAVGGLEDVVGSEHQRAGLGLCLGAQREVDSHLVAVEVGVERGAGERRQVDGLAFDQDRLERLDAQTVQRRRTVEQHGMLGYDLFEYAPHLGVAAVDETLGALHVLREVHVDQTLDDERLEQLQRHRLRQTALVHAQRRADDDHGTAGVVDSLTQQVLTEAALLALEHVRKGLERAVRGAGDGTAAAAVVEQGVNGFLQHALFVADDDLGRAEFHEPLQAVVAVDDAAVQIIEVGRGEAAAVQGDEGTKFRRDDGNDFHDHPFGTVVGLDEGLDDLEALGDFLLLGLALGEVAFLPELIAQDRQVELLEQRADGFGAHAHGHAVFGAVMVDDLQVLILGDDLLLLQGGLAGIEDNVAVEVEHLLEIIHGHVEKGADLGRQRLEEPDVGDGSGELDVAHAFAAHLGGDDLDAALFADDAAVLHALVLAAVALVVLHGAEDLGAEETVAFRLEGAVVDGFGLFDFAVRPFADDLRRGNGYPDGLQVAHVGDVARSSAV